MKILKFGGSSVATPDRVRNVLQILQNYYSQGEKIAVVFSAFGGVTDDLLEMSQLAARGEETYLERVEAFSQRHNEAAHELLQAPYLDRVLPHLEVSHEVLKNLLYGVFLVREASPRTLDYVLSFGERNAAFIISFALQQLGVNANYLDARSIIKTNKAFGKAKVDLDMTYHRIVDHFAQHPEVQVVTGFIASAKGGLTTTLGRGGSDYTASLLAAALDAEQLEIWTDVEGVLTADPRKVRKAFTIHRMSYAEAMEMSHFGAKVIYPPTLQPILNKRIPLRIKNTFRPEFDGTLIDQHAERDNRAITGISSISEVALLTLQGSGLIGVPGTAGRLFGALAQAGVNIILITQGSSEHSISFAVEPGQAARARRTVEEAFVNELSRALIEPVKVEQNLSVVAIIGEKMRYQPGIAGRMFQGLGKNGVNAVAIAQGSSELNISVVINRSDEAKALNALHEAFFLSDTRVLHLFIVGVGLIGSTLLRQIQDQQEKLKDQQSLEIKVIALANSRTMLFQEEGIDLANWEKKLQDADDQTNIGRYVQQMKQLNLENSIFLDNTADPKITDYYETILDASIPISTPNKIATSSSFLRYQRLKSIAAMRGVQFMYETNVGAGLPVLTTLNDLLLSGDQIQRIEAVLSGSLSFIFNTFGPATPFSEVVKIAQERGYTEPDPRVDLGGTDVKRKLIILAREIGLAIEAPDVTVDGFLPDPVMDAPDPDAFWSGLSQADAPMQERAEAAAMEGKKLRFLARLDGGHCSIQLEAVGPESPFYQLSGSDNMIVFTTDRYRDRPLVVRGPGAGAEVTAAGIFSEIIRIGNYLPRL